MRFPTTKLIAYSYLSLSSIPITFSFLSTYHYLRGNHDKARAHAFWAWTGWCSLPLGIVMLAVTPYSLLTDPVDRRLIGKIQQLWAQYSIGPFLNIKVIHHSSSTPHSLSNTITSHTDNNNKKTKRNEIIVANHSSWLDPYILMAIMGDEYVNLRFISKSEIFYIPLVGWVMYLIGHIPLNRSDRQSGKEVIKQCTELFNKSSQSLSIVFFAEGSRPRVWVDNCQVGEFKIGAFKLSTETHVPIRPISIYGSRQAMPPGKELEYLTNYLDQPILVYIHDTIDSVVDDKTQENQQQAAIKLRDQTRETIVKGLQILKDQNKISNK
jgi:1-acyl-sn-glycerol-3-phosphate acyltransferase